MKIMRVWHGYTSPKNADAYERLLRSEILPGIHRIAGFGGAYLLRRDLGEEVEFMTITTWDSWEAIGRFAGADHTGAVVPPKARALLARFDDHSQHYSAAWVP